MLFNSFEFLVFFIAVFLLYWSISKYNLLYQNSFILAVSYVFYGWWDYRFLSLIILSTVIDFIAGKYIAVATDKKRKKIFLTISIVVNIGLLAVFKYYNFFIASWVSLFEGIGVEVNPNTINVILPVGISFYTFQTLSYTIDIYRGKMKATNSFISFAAFVAFFPQLVAGPIERASNLLPQFFKKRKFNNHLAVTGSRLILWGIFKKVVIADNCAPFVNEIFANYHMYNGFSLALGAIFFAFQIYCDFSGYSDIAIGTGRLLGFELMRNFKYPYFSRDIAEFWRRWHISLSTWFRDYVYIPLGGSKGSKWFQLRNVLIIFVVSGLWHGANWTFIFWGFLNAVYFIPLLLRNKNRENLGEVSVGSFFVKRNEFFGIIITFCLTCFAWIFFRAESIQYASKYIIQMVEFDAPLFLPSLKLVGLLLFFNMVEWLGRTNECPIMLFKNLYLRRLQYYLLIFLILYFGRFGYNEFIYFQF
jgi:D-alanyl-lipoteichoic acid acyltransferase DltB (MBOAT superfamily)